MHISIEDIKSLVIKNPDLYGNSAENKEYRLDINILLNDTTIIDIEMQVVYSKYWKNRALVYLCRDLDDIPKGGNYSELKQAVHIGIVKNVPKDKSRGFFSQYMLTDVNTEEIYSDRLIIYMMDLGKVEEATEEDKKWGLVDWARLFNAKTWEEARMAAMNNEYVEEAANTMYYLNSDWLARRRAREREDYYAHEKYLNDTINKQKAEIAEKNAEIAEKNAEIAELRAKLAAKN